MLRSLLLSALLLGSVANGMAAVPPPGVPGTAHAKGSQITLNLKDADIREVAQMVSAITGKNFVVDPRAQGRVTVISSRPISAAALFSVFLSVLNVQGLTAIPSGNNTWKIVPSIEGRQNPGVAPGTAHAPGDAMETRVTQLHNITVAQLVPALRPLMSSQAQLAAYTPSNMLIISGRVANVQRILRLARKLDQPVNAKFSLIQLKYASAVAISHVLTSMLQGNRGRQGQLPMKLAADPRTNSILVSGSPAQQLQVRALISQLDQPTGSTGNTRVIYLHYARSEDLSKILQGYAKAQQQAQRTAGAKTGGNQPAIDIIPDKSLNALIVTAPPKAQAEIQQIVKELDVRRAQVLVQGIIAELSSSSAAQLGISWAALSSGIGGVTNFPNGISSLAQLAGSVAGAGSGGTGVPSLNLPGGLLFGVGHIVQNGTSFVALLNALSSDVHTNILSTPSLVTLDNEKAKLISGQKVPFVTGQYTNTGGGGISSGRSNLINPFQTVNRQQIGLDLEITPQINYGGDTVTLKIDAKNSSIAPSVQGAAGIVTNNREVQSTIIARNHQIIVLGGLISTNLSQSQKKVPLLGDIPLLGNLFRYRSSSKTRQNLMIFLRPTILRNPKDTTLVTASRYNEIRQLQINHAAPIPLLPHAKPPVLPRLHPSGRRATAPETATLILATPAAATGHSHGQHR